MKSKLNSVLLIDDDEPTNFLNKWVIEHSGFAEHVKVAPSGQDALDFLSDTAVSPGIRQVPAPIPDLIFLDINMPAMNGWEFLEKYKELPGYAPGKTVLVMLTTSLFPEDIQRAADAPEIAAFESKPLTNEILTKLLEKHFIS